MTAQLYPTLPSNWISYTIWSPDFHILAQDFHDGHYLASSSIDAASLDELKRSIAAGAWTLAISSTTGDTAYHLQPDLSSVPASFFIDATVSEPRSFTALSPTTTFAWDFTGDIDYGYATVHSGQVQQVDAIDASSPHSWTPSKPLAAGSGTFGLEWYAAPIAPLPMTVTRFSGPDQGLVNAVLESSNYMQIPYTVVVPEPASLAAAMAGAAMMLGRRRR